MSKAYQDCVVIAGITVRITQQRTGFGYRRYFLCPCCGRKCGKVHLYEEVLYCQRCIPLSLYRYRQGLYDEGGSALIVWHMERLAEKVGIKRIKFPYWFLDYPDKSPLGIGSKRYLKTLLTIQAMERLRTAAIFLGCRFTAREIKELSKEL